ncbi:MAG: DUF4956 domain-containing protein [Gemmiger sp.]
MLDSILTPGTPFTIAQLAACSAVSVALGLLCASLSLYKNRPAKGFVVTLALLPLMVQMVILLVNGSLGTGVAVMGAFGLVRFRSLPGSARDIASIFLAMAVGLAAGTGYLGVAVLFALGASLVELILLASPLGEGDARERELRVTVPETLEFEGAFDDLFDRYTDRAELESVKTSGMGSVFELKYRVRLRRDAPHKEFLDELRCRNGNLPIQLCHTGTQEMTL